MTPEEKKAYYREYYRVHRAEMLAKQKAYYENNLEERKAYQREYEKQPEIYRRKLEYNRNYSKTPKMRKWQREYRRKKYARRKQKSNETNTADE